MRSAVRQRSSSNASIAAARLLISLELGRLRLLERGLRLVAPTRKFFHLLPLVLDHRQSAPLRRIQVIDHAVRAPSCRA